MELLRRWVLRYEPGQVPMLGLEAGTMGMRGPQRKVVYGRSCPHPWDMHTLGLQARGGQEEVITLGLSLALQL